ncbi:uncharacterized protein LOC115147581 isoform X1 [Salmo trutta]|nr:uncharacterized protein LOC115147581 isoform X1 [Salmo trutta]XP_029545703.1 uncharacterized protein LOC115147581 isoform X1 [Salmo trutta]
MDYVYTPAFRLEPSGALTLRASEEAARVARTIQEEECTGVVRVLKPRQVKAKACVVARGGDPDDSRLVDSERAIQFGKYRGQTFKWLLSHNVGYAVMVLASHQQEREMGDTDMSPEMANKDQFDWYTNLFPEVQKAVEERRVRDGTLPPRPDQEDSCLVGFGNHKSLTYKDLYEAKDKERKSYMACFRKYQVKPGTSMGHFKVYFQRRDTATAVEPPNPSAEPSDQELLSICVGFDQGTVLCYGTLFISVEKNIHMK